MACIPIERDFGARTLSAIPIAGEEAGYICFDTAATINKNLKEGEDFKGMKYSLGNHRPTTVETIRTEAYVKNRVSTPLEAWKNDLKSIKYFMQTDVLCTPWDVFLSE